MPTTPLSDQARRASWRVFVLVLVSSAWFHQSAGHNEAARLDQMASIAERGEWWIDRYASNTADVIHVAGHTFPGKAPGTSLLGAPLWNPLRRLGGLVVGHPGQQATFASYVLTLLMASLPTALVSLLILRFLDRNGWTVPQATLMALGYGLGSLAFPWSTLLFGHQLSAAFAFGGFYLVWKARWSGGRPTLGLRIAAGLLLGFLPVIEHPGAIATVLIGIYALAVLGVRASVPFLLAGVVGALPLPLYNLAAFGNPLSMGYGYYAQKGSAFPAHQVGLMGVSWPKANVLREITFGVQRGLFHTTPWLAALFAAPFLSGRHRGRMLEGGLALAVVACFFLFNAGYGDSLVYWGGGYSFGPRHMLIALPFAVVLAAVVAQSRRLALPFGILIALTAALMLTVTAVDPRFPYEPREPFLGFYLPLFARGNFSVNGGLPFGPIEMFRAAGASNFGRAVGLPRELEIAPLALLWALAIPLLFPVRSTRARLLAVAWAGFLLAVGLGPATARAIERSREQAGLCQSFFPDEARSESPGFAVFTVPPKPPIRSQVEAPSSDSPDTAEVFDADRHAAVTAVYSGFFRPVVAGWHRVQMWASGNATVYIDGSSRLRTSDAQLPGRDARALVFLTADAHEIVVRYSSARRIRSLRIEVAGGADPMRPWRHGLTSGACEAGY